MLSIGKLRDPDYYLREVVDGAEDYYLAPGEAPGTGAVGEQPSSVSKASSTGMT